MRLYITGFLGWVKKQLRWGDITGQKRSETLNYRKKAIDYALDKLNPMIQSVGSQALNQLSTKIRPKKNYKTNRKDLDGGAGASTSRLVNYQNQQDDGLYQDIGIQALTTISKIKSDTIQKLVKY